MRLYWGFALAAVLALTPTIASAQIQLNISMAYQWSNDGSGNTATLPNVAVPGSSGSTLSQVNLGGRAYVNHVFNVYATVTGLSSDQDVTMMIFGGALTGGVPRREPTRQTLIRSIPRRWVRRLPTPRPLTWYEADQAISWLDGRLRGACGHGHEHGRGPGQHLRRLRR